MKQRAIGILNRLLISNNPISKEIIVEEYQVSERTIRNDVNEINELLIENYLPKVVYKRNEGYLLTLSSNEVLLIKELIKEENEQETFLRKDSRLLDLLLSIALDNEKIILSNKEKEYDVSKSSLDDDMRRLRKFIENYHLYIASTPKKGLILEGAERDILNLLFDVISKFSSEIGIKDILSGKSATKSILTNHVGADVLNKVNDIVKTNISNSIDENYVNNTILMTSLWISRVKKVSKQRTNNKNTFDFSIITNIQLANFIKSINKEFCINPSNHQLKNLIEVLNVFYPDTLDEIIDWSTVQIITLQLIKFVEEETGIKYINTSLKFHQGLYRHVGALLKRLRNGIQFKNPLTSNIKQNSAVLYSSIKKYFYQNKEQFVNEISDDEVAYLTIYFSTVDSEIRQQGEYFYKVAVICNHGKATGQMLSESLKEFFNVEVVAVIGTNEINIIEKLDVDLLFSTFPIEYKDKPLLVIDPIISESDKQLIMKFLDSHLKSRRYVSNNNFQVNKLFKSLLRFIESNGININSNIHKNLKLLLQENKLYVDDEEVKPLIKDVLTENKVQVNLELENWEQSIREVAKPLLESGEISESYIEAMVKSVNEYGPYIVIGKGIALAHARPEDGVNDIGLSVATLHPPIRFGHEDNDPVSIIFCLAAIDSFSHLNIMKELVSLMQNEKKIKRIIESKKPTEVINFLVNEGGIK